MLQIMRIEGESMAPKYHDGDYVLLRSDKRAVAKLKVGDVIAFRQIAYGVMVKRVHDVEPNSGLVTVMGDNLDHSTDSRLFGPVPKTDIIGKVIWHIASGGS
jgi:nickel-type superoxide dismutase maturation protease